MKLAIANEQELEPSVAYERQLLELPDGGIVSLDWALPLRKDGSATPLAEIDRNKRTVLVLPGLTGGSREHYIRSAVHCLRRKGWQVVVLNARGCADTPLATPHFFCIAYTSDVRYVARYLSETYNFQSEALVGLGFSLGSNVLVKYLGEEQASTPLTAAISVGNPFDVVRCSANIDGTLFNRLTYGRVLNTSLLQLVFEKVRGARHTPAMQGLASDTRSSETRATPTRSSRATRASTSTRCAAPRACTSSTTSSRACSSSTPACTSSTRTRRA